MTNQEISPFLDSCKNFHYIISLAKKKIKKIVFTDLLKMSAVEARIIVRCIFSALSFQGELYSLSICFLSKCMLIMLIKLAIKRLKFIEIILY